MLEQRQFIKKVSKRFLRKKMHVQSKKGYISRQISHEFDIKSHQITLFRKLLRIFVTLNEKWYIIQKDCLSRKFTQKHLK